MPRPLGDDVTPHAISLKLPLRCRPKLDRHPQITPSNLQIHPAQPVVFLFQLE